MGAPADGTAKVGSRDAACGQQHPIKDAKGGRRSRGKWRKKKSTSPAQQEAADAPNEGPATKTESWRREVSREDDHCEATTAEPFSSPEPVAPTDGRASSSPASCSSEASTLSSQSSLEQDDEEEPAAPPQPDFVDAAEVLPGLATMLERIVGLCGGRQHATVFHCRQPPQISIAQYLERLHQYFCCSPECFVMALTYIDRLIRRHPSFKVSALSVHRVLLVALTISAKFQDDVFYSNKHYSRIGGLHLKELNHLETAMLQLLDYRLSICPEEFAWYYAALKTAAKGATARAAAESTCPQQQGPAESAAAGAAVRA